MASQLVKRNKELERENEELRSEREELEGKIREADVRRQYLEYQIEKLRRMLFGRRSEKLPPRDDGLKQLELFEEAKREVELEELQETEEITYERKKRRGQRRPTPEDIHREQVVVDVDPELRQCPDCGEEMDCIGHDVSEDLEYIPALLFIIEYHLRKYACKKCQSGVIQAARPPRPIPKARPGAGLLAYVLVSKYEDHLPLHRLERIFQRHGLGISRKTLCDWVGKIAELLRPIVEAMKRRFAEARLLQSDETPINVQNPEVKGKTTKGQIWTYGIPDEEVIYDFTMGRSAAGPEEFFGGKYPEFLQSDGYSVYKSLDRQGKTVYVGCWAHARRKYYDARAEDPTFTNIIISAVQKLFRIEREAKSEGVVGESLVELRRERSLPILESIKNLAEEKRHEVVPESGLGKAIDYMLSNWEGLTRYVEIPEAPISNNSAESSLRGVVCGRKNWLFIGHPDAGPRAATIISLIETCRRLGIEPYQYLKSVITELAADPERAPDLTPRSWLERERAAAENPSDRAAR